MDLGKLLLPAGLLVGYWLYTQQKAIGLLNYYIRDIGSLDFDGITPIIRIDVGIQNPSNTQFEVNDFIGNLSANGENIGTMSAFTKAVVPPASQIIYPVYIRMNPIGIVSDIVALIQKQSGLAQTIVLDGYVNANGIVAPVHLNYKIAF